LIENQGLKGSIHASFETKINGVMENILIILINILIGIVFYAYVGYGMLIWVLLKFKKQK
jgi:hypothetical protein